MRTPGFIAQAPLHIGSIRNRVVGALQERDADTRQDCVLDCVVDCVESGQSRSACRSKCEDKCRSHIPPYQCTPQDNSVNRNLCLGGIWAWEQACIAECGLLGGIDVIGPALAAACKVGCTTLANRMRADCPPTTICV
jgi:hypothetical protein